MEEKKDVSYQFTPLELIKKDRIYIILLLLALLACMYTIYTVGDYQEKCNEHWEEQFSNGNCVCKGYAKFNESPTLPLLNTEIEWK